jgi:hypothetical protein
MKRKCPSPFLRKRKILQIYLFNNIEHIKEQKQKLCIEELFFFQNLIFRARFIYFGYFTAKLRVYISLAKLPK